MENLEHSFLNARHDGEQLNQVSIQRGFVAEAEPLRESLEGIQRRTRHQEGHGALCGSDDDLGLGKPLELLIPHPGAGLNDVGQGGRVAFVQGKREIPKETQGDRVDGETDVAGPGGGSWRGGKDLPWPLSFLLGLRLFPFDFGGRAPGGFIRDGLRL